MTIMYIISEFSVIHSNKPYYEKVIIINIAF